MNIAALIAALGLGACGTVEASTTTINTTTVETWAPEAVPEKAGPELASLMVFGHAQTTTYRDATIAREGTQLRVTRRGETLALIARADAELVRGAREEARTSQHVEGHADTLAWGLSGAAMAAVTIVLIVVATQAH